MGLHEPPASKDDDRRAPEAGAVRRPRVARAGRSTLPPEKALARACEHLMKEASDLLESLITAEEDGALVARARLHPGARDATLTLTDDGQARWEAPTAAVGPGYHRAMVDLGDGLAPALGCEDLGPTLEEHGTADPEGTFIRWLRAAVATADASRDPFREVGLPGPLYPSTGESVATVTGARDTAWVTGLLEGRHDGRDAFPWWQKGRGAHVHIGRARVLLAFALRGRPLASEQEAESYEAILEDLDAASELSRELGPWKPLRGFIEDALIGNPPHVDDGDPFDTRLDGVPAPRPYRLGPVHRDVGAGICIPLEAALVEREDDSGIFLGEGERALRIAGFALPEEMAPEATFELLDLPTSTVAAELPPHLPPGAQLRMSTVDAGGSPSVEAGLVLRGRALRVRAEWPSGDATRWVRSLLEGLELR